MIGIIHRIIKALTRIPPQLIRNTLFSNPYALARSYGSYCINSSSSRTNSNKFGMSSNSKSPTKVVLISSGIYESISGIKANIYIVLMKPHVDVRSPVTYPLKIPALIVVATVVNTPSETADSSELSYSLLLSEDEF